MKSLVFAVALCSAILPVAATANESWEDLSTRTALAALDSAPPVTGPAIAAAYRVPIRPDVTAPKVIIGFVAVGPAQTGTPCFACVKGAQSTANIGLTAPFNYIASGESIQYAMTFTDVTNKASCVLSWAVAAGAKVLDKFSYTFKAPAVGSAYVYGFNRSRPVFSGSAVVTGKVACVGAAAPTTKGTLFFQ